MLGPTRLGFWRAQCQRQRLMEYLLTCSESRLESGLLRSQFCFCSQNRAYSLMLIWPSNKRATHYPVATTSRSGDITCVCDPPAVDMGTSVRAFKAVGQPSHAEESSYTAIEIISYSSYLVAGKDGAAPSFGIVAGNRRCQPHTKDKAD